MKGIDASKPWLSTFLGTTRELDELKAKYRALVTEKKSQAAILLGESGSGKTRLVQEFYRWVAASDREENGARYWPEKLSDAGNNLAINPSFDDIEIDWTTTPNFIWWGLRFVQVVARNHVDGNALNSYLPYLIPHFFSFELASKKKALVRESIETALNVGVDLSLNFVSLGFAGFIKSAIDAGMKAKDILEHTNRLNQSRQNTRYANEVAQKTETVADSLIHDFSEFYRLSERTKPFILVLDDAQWAKYDRYAFAFLGRLLEECAVRSWPIFLIVTAWTSDWYGELERFGTNEAESASVMGLLAKFGLSPEAASQPPYAIHLKKNKQLSAMLEAALPGLEAAQREKILERADGNPQLLDELICYYRLSKHLFVNYSIKKPLKRTGLDLCLREKFNLDSLARERFLALPLPLKRVLGAATLPASIEFSPAYLECLFASAKVRIDVGKAIDQLTNAYCVTQVSQNRLIEFRHRSYFNAAEDFFRSDADFSGKFSSDRIALGSLEAACLGDDFSSLRGTEKRWLLELCIPYREARIADCGDLEKYAYLQCRMIEREMDESNAEAATARLNRLFAAFAARPDREEELPIRVNHEVLEVARTILHASARSGYLAESQERCARYPRKDAADTLAVADCLALIGELAFRRGDYPRARRAVSEACALLDGMGSLPVTERKIRHRFLLLRLNRTEGGAAFDGRTEAELELLARDIAGGAARLEPNDEKNPSYREWLAANVRANLLLHERGRFEVEEYLVYTDGANAVSFMSKGPEVYGTDTYRYFVQGRDLHVVYDEELTAVFVELSPGLVEKLRSRRPIVHIVFAETRPMGTPEFDADLRNGRLAPIAATPIYHRDSAEFVTWAEIIGLDS